MNKIECKDVGKVYKSSGKYNESVSALEYVNLSVRSGEILAIVGPSGCGKTTLLNIMAGLEKPESGCVFVDGEEVKGPGADRGMCFQDFALFPWKTVVENIEFGPKIRNIPVKQRQKIVESYVRMVNLSGFEHKYPHELSGGMKQRCALARMLANKSDIWLMDEPLASADAQTRAILQSENMNIWEEERQEGTMHTVVYVTHNIEEAVYLSENIAVMSARPGRIKRIIHDPLPRPRTDEIRRSSEYSELRLNIWELIKEEALEAMKYSEKK